MEALSCLSLNVENLSKVKNVEVSAMFSFFHRFFQSSNSPLAPFDQLKQDLKSIKNLTPSQSLDWGEIESASVSIAIMSEDIGQIYWQGRYVAAKLLSDVAKQWQGLPTQLTKGDKIVILGTHNGHYVVTTRDSIQAV